MEWLNWIIENWQGIVGALSALLGSLLLIFRLIPGEQGEPILQGIVDFLKKLTKNEKKN